jgi:hypothetical protein
MAIYDRGHVVIIAQVDSPGYWGFAIRTGSHIGLFNTGSGHVLLAFASLRDRGLMVEEHRLMPHESVPPDLDDRLATVKAQGYESMRSQQTAGVLNGLIPLSPLARGRRLSCCAPAHPASCRQPTAEDAEDDNAVPHHRYASSSDPPD